MRQSFVNSIGRKQWAIGEGYIPPYGHGPAPQMVSHEAICILNAGDEEAHIAITIFYEDRDPVGPYRFAIAPRRSRHLRFNNFKDPEKIPVDTPFSSVIASDVPIVVQHTRLDSRQAQNALLSTIAFPGSD
ncbi:MAG TPA: sensory rhodopsin transducer [Bryobacteraceae bacterium]